MNEKNDIQCLRSELTIVNKQGNKDFVCMKLIDAPTGYHVCYCNRYCNFYEPMVQDLGFNPYQE